MEAKVGLTLACLNIKKLVKMMTEKTYNFTQISQYYWIIGELGKNIKKTNIKNDVCLHSEKRYKRFFYLLEGLCSRLYLNLKNGSHPATIFLFIRCENHWNNDWFTFCFFI